jgi:hypothetical protein
MRDLARIVKKNINTEEFKDKVDILVVASQLNKRPKPKPLEIGPQLEPELKLTDSMSPRLSMRNTFRDVMLLKLKE